MAPLIPATAVASITSLRSSLRYGDPREPCCQSFYDDVRAFRKKFVTSTGIQGKDLHQWKLKEHQAGLSEMVHAYLEKQENGALYWPDDPTSEMYNGIEYSQEFAEIQRLLKHLFFRLNLQQYRNEKYRPKPKSDANGIEQRGTSIEDPVDVDDIDHDRFIDPSGHRDPTASPQLPVTGHSRARSHSTDAENNDPTPRRHQRNASGEMNRLAESQSSVPASPVAANTEAPTTTGVSRSVNQVNLNCDEHPAEPPTKRLKLTLSNSKGTNKHQLLPKERTLLHDSATPGKQRRGRYVQHTHTVAAQNSIVDSVASSSRATSPLPSPDPGEEVDPSYRSNMIDKHLERLRRVAGIQPIPTVEAVTDDDDNIPAAQDEPRAISTGTLLDPSTELPREPEPGTKEGPGDVVPEIQQPVPSHPKPVVKLGFSVVRSRVPVSSSVRWIPKGNFSDKTLLQIKKEIPIEVDADPSAKGLLFTLLGPGCNHEFGVADGEEDELAFMKQFFKDRLRDHIPNDSGPLPVNFVIQIEALRDETSNPKTERARYEGNLDDVDL